MSTNPFNLLLKNLTCECVVCTCVCVCVCVCHQKLFFRLCECWNLFILPLFYIYPTSSITFHQFLLPLSFHRSVPTAIFFITVVVVVVILGTR